MEPLKDLLDKKREARKMLRLGLKSAKTPEEKARIQKQIDNLDEFIHRFRASSTEPCYVEGLLINYKLYKKVMRKLKAFDVIQYVDGPTLIIRYKNRTVNGKYTLLDLSGFFPSNADFPKAELIVKE